VGQARHSSLPEGKRERLPYSVVAAVCDRRQSHGTSVSAAIDRRYRRFCRQWRRQLQQHKLQRWQEISLCV